MKTRFGIRFSPKFVYLFQLSIYPQVRHPFCTLKLCCDCRFQRVITACSWVFKFFYQLKTQQFEFSNFEITHLCVNLMRKTTVATSLDIIDLNILFSVLLNNLIQKERTLNSSRTFQIPPLFTFWLFSITFCSPLLGRQWVHILVNIFYFRDWYFEMVGAFSCQVDLSLRPLL
jgi:hypothetical protein